MTARRIFGIETEYGLTCASLDGQAPPMDADEAARHLFKPVVVAGRSTNVFLRNGGRLYLDVGSHPEYATAECDTLPDLLEQDRAGAQMLRQLAQQANTVLAEQGVRGQLHLFKNNVDNAGNAFGCHENYLVRRRPDFKARINSLIPYFVSRQIVAGSGSVTIRQGRAHLAFSQRATQTWDAMSSATTRSRPIVNTRDEPHADAERFRRLHVIVGDSNMAEGSTLVKVAATNLVLAALEAGEKFGVELADPMRAIREFSGDLTGEVTAELTDGRHLTAAQIQRVYFNAVRGAEVDQWHAAALDLWERALRAVETGDHAAVDTELDWAAKAKLIRSYELRQGATVAGVRRLALEYHDITGTLHERMEATGLLRRFTLPARVTSAVTVPPATTRAHVRGAFIAAAEDARRDFAADWVHLKLSDPSERSIALTDPFAATDPRVDALIERIS